MREIKFRAWDWHNKVFKFYTLKQLADYDQFGYDTEYEAIQSGFDNWKWDEYTGLKDKNGKEIYEGDIVNYAIKKTFCKSKDCENEHELGIDKFCPSCGNKVSREDFITTAKVVFHKSGFAYRQDVSEDCYQSWPIHASEIYIEWVEVIGNIYESAENLKQLIQ